MQFTLIDGGMGRELQRMGAPFGQPEWSAKALLEAPKWVSQAHQRFIQAGAEVITTNNYAVAPFHLGQTRFEQQGAPLSALAGQLAQAAVQGTTVKVAGCLPPLHGSYRPDLFQPELAAKQYPIIIEALAPFIDHWQAETLASLREAKTLVSALGKQRKPLWLAFTLADEPEAKTARLRSGESLSEALSLSIDSGAEALLFNCSLPEVIGQAIKQLARERDRRAPTLRLGGYGNSFTPRTEQAQANSELAEIRPALTPEHYRDFAAQWLADGADIVGGCCGIGPEHIQALRALQS